MRRIRYQVASSLDGYIAGPNGEYDWIVMDPDIDFTAIFAQFDTLLMGRRTYEIAGAGSNMHPGVKTIVFSRTMRPEDHPDVTIVADDVPRVLDELRAQPGKDIWLFGGGELFRSLLSLGYVDTVEPAVIPVLLGGGIPLLPAPGTRASLELTGHRLFSRSGIMLLEYAVRPAPPAKRKSKRGRRTADADVSA